MKPGYANFAIADPPLKLVLFEGPEGATLNHLGVEVDTAEEVVSAERRLSATGLETTGVDETICCFAEKAETWVVDPDGARWEWYVKSGDAEQIHNTIVPQSLARRSNRSHLYDGLLGGDRSCLYDLLLLTRSHGQFFVILHKASRISA